MPRPVQNPSAQGGSQLLGCPISDPSPITHPGVTPHVEPQNRLRLGTLREEPAKQLRGQETEPLLWRVEAGIMREISERGGPRFQNLLLAFGHGLLNPEILFCGRRH